MSKPVILVFTCYYLPGSRAGGPVRTIANLVSQLGEEFEFRIVCWDRDLGDAESYRDVKVGVWTQVDDAFVWYVKPGSFNFFEIIKITKSVNYNAVYLNSFFSPQFSFFYMICDFLRLVKRSNIIVAPRGELSVAALSIKWLKKRIYIWVVKLFGLYKRVIWQASSELEADDIRRVMFGSDENNFGTIVVAPNLTSKVDNSSPGALVVDAVDDRVFKICFLGRINRIKNLDFALAVLEGVNASTEIQFTVYGPIENAQYWVECEEIAHRLPENINLVLAGAIDNLEVVSALQSHDLFFLPTQGENFGHAIFEALKAGLPILISDKTPWIGLVEKGIGWDLPLNNISAFHDAIEACMKWDGKMRAEVSRRCERFADAVASNNLSICANRDLFLHAIRPETVV